MLAPSGPGRLLARAIIVPLSRGGASPAAGLGRLDPGHDVQVGAAATWQTLFHLPIVR